MDAPASVEGYLAALSAASRAALEKLRKTIRAAAPGAIEAKGWGMPAFKYRGRPLVAYPAFKDHRGFFPMSTRVMEGHQEKLEACPTSKGTIRFSPDRPFPATLVRKLVKERLAENTARRNR
jgi:uncharacterized protein YdhG (YjbR/CyaY superfamily)